MRNNLNRLNIFLVLHHTRIVALLISSLLLGGFVYAWSLGDVLRFLPDEADYVQLAANLTTQQRYTLNGSEPTAYRAPGYPLLLAGAQLLGAGIVEFRMLNFLFLAGSLWLVSKILRREHSAQAGALGGLLVLAYPVLFFTAGTLYPQTFAAFLFLLSLYILTRPVLSNRMALLAGLLSGYLILTVPSFILILPIYSIWLWTSGQPERRTRLAVMLSAILFLVSLWSMRNFLIFHAFVPLTTNSGENLLYGNSARTTPNAGTTVDISEYRQAAASLGEIEQDRYYRLQAWEFILQNPFASARLFALKFLNYFNFRNQLASTTQASSARDFLLLLSYGLLLGTTLVRLLYVRSWPLSRLEILFLCLYLTSGLFHAVFFTRIRLRLPFDYLLILLSALFGGEILSRLTHADVAGRPTQTVPGR